MTLRLTKRFTFDMAHALPTYNGKCAGVHGHTYHLSVTVEGTHPGTGEGGMVIDFARLKTIVERAIIEPFDHSLVLPDLGGEPFSMEPYSAKLHLTPFHPTTENLLLHFASLIEPELPTGVRLQALSLSETETSTAELIL